MQSVNEKKVVNYETLPGCVHKRSSMIILSSTQMILNRWSKKGRFLLV